MEWILRKSCPSSNIFILKYSDMSHWNFSHIMITGIKSMLFSYSFHEHLLAVHYALTLEADAEI